MIYFDINFKVKLLLKGTKTNFGRIAIEIAKTFFQRKSFVKLYTCVLKLAVNIYAYGLNNIFSGV